MADAGTLATTAQVLLAIGQDASAAQILETNTNIWILVAESEIEAALGDNVDIVANYSNVTAEMKQYIAAVAFDRAGWYGVKQNQSNWTLSVTQSKLNTLDATWSGFLARIKDNKADLIADLNL